MLTAERRYITEVEELETPLSHLPRRKVKINYRRMFAAFLTCFTLTFVISMLYLSYFTVITKNSFHISDLNKDKTSLQHEEDLIDIEIAKTASYSNISQLAKQRLSMGEPEKVQYLAARSQEGTVIYTAKNNNMDKKDRKDNGGMFTNLCHALFGFGLVSPLN